MGRSFTESIDVLDKVCDQVTMLAFQLVSLLMLGWAALADTVPLQVLARPGDVATDGTRLGEFSGLVSVRGRLVARADEVALVRVAGDIRTALVQLGDPLPPPLTGRFESLGALDVGASGAVVFTAPLPSPQTGDGLFEVDDAGVRVLAPELGFTDRARSVTTNAAGDVLVSYKGALMLWRRADGTITSLVSSTFPDGATLSGISAVPGLSDDGTVAFVAIVRQPRGRRPRDVLRIYRLTPDGTLTILAEYTRRASSLTTKHSVIAVNPRGDVAQILGWGSADGVFLHPAEGGPPIRVAGPGDTVSGGVLQKVRRGVLAVDDQRRVAFLAQLHDGRHVVLADASGLRSLAGPLSGEEWAVRGGRRLPDSLSVAWQIRGLLFRSEDGSEPVLGPSIDEPLGLGFAVAGAPAVNRAGVMAVWVTRGALYELADTGARPVLRTGDAVDGGRVRELFDHSASAAGDLLASVALDNGPYALLLKSKQAGWRQLLTSADRNDHGNEINGWDLSACDTRRGAVVAALSLGGSDYPFLHELRPGFPPKLLSILTPERTPFEGTGQPVLLDDGLAFMGWKAGENEGSIFVRRRNAVRALVSPGTRVRGSRVASIIAVRPVGSGNGLLVVAALEDSTTGLFAWRPGDRLRRVDRPDWPWDSTWLVGGPRVVASAGSLHESDPFAISLLAPRGVQTLVVAGDPSPLGGSLTLDAFEGNERPLALTRRGVAFLERSAVLEAALTRREKTR